MQSIFSQYSPQGLVSPQGAGWPQQLSPGLFGQPGVNSGNALFGQESGQAGLGPQYPFGQNPFAQNPFGQSPFAATPYLQGPQSQGYPGQNPLQGSFAGQQAPHLTQHVIALLGQLAQQFSIHNVLTQQIGIALHQLVQQLAAQSSGGGLGVGGGQYFGQNPFAGVQGGYGGFNPQAAHAWGANRPQTIQ
jgi:hypothetical protein